MKARQLLRANPGKAAKGERLKLVSIYLFICGILLSYVGHEVLVPGILLIFGAVFVALWDDKRIGQRKENDDHEH
jgi:hypothetical protein